MLYEDKIISSIEWETYNYWFGMFKNYSQVDKILYIKTSPEKCLERINTRNREEESNIKLDYLIKCNEK
jgi:deoxyadenosine/deoxycytidine kinase